MVKNLTIKRDILPPYLQIIYEFSNAQLTYSKQKTLVTRIFLAQLETVIHIHIHTLTHFSAPIINQALMEFIHSL